MVWWQSWSTLSDLFSTLLATPRHFCFPHRWQQVSVYEKLPATHTFNEEKDVTVMELDHYKDLRVSSLSEAQWCQSTSAHASPHGRASDTPGSGLQLLLLSQFPSFGYQAATAASIWPLISVSCQCRRWHFPHQHVFLKLKLTPSCCFMHRNSHVGIFGSCLVCMWSVHRHSYRKYLLWEGKRYYVYADKSWVFFLLRWNYVKNDWLS